MMTINTMENKLEIIETTDDNFRQSWQSFQNEYLMYSNRYQLPIFEYYEMRSNKAINRSFVIKNKDMDKSTTDEFKKI